MKRNTTWDNQTFTDANRNVSTLNGALGNTDQLLKTLQKTIDSARSSMDSFGSSSRKMLPGKSAMATLRENHQQNLDWMHEEARTREELDLSAMESQKQQQQVMLDTLRNSLDLSSDMQYSEYLKLQEMAIEHQSASTAIMEYYTKERNDIRQKELKRELARQKELLSGTADMFGDMADIARAYGRDGFEAWKRLSMVQAVLDGLQAVQSAYAWGMKYGGAAAPFVAAAAAAVATAKTAANVAEIEAQTYAYGGYVSGPGSGTSDSIPAFLSNGEYVVNAQAASGNLDLLHAINHGSTGSLGEKLDRISSQLRALNINLIKKEFSVRTGSGRDSETIVAQIDAVRQRLTLGGYDGSGENLAL